MSIEIHALAFVDPIAARGADLFVSLSSGLHTVNSSPRPADGLSWDDALFELHLTHLPARVCVSVCEQGLFSKPRTRGMVVLSVERPNTEPTREVILDLSCGLRALLSWCVWHNETPQSLPTFTTFPCAPREQDQYRIFAGTWNMGNAAPLFARTNGLGFLDQARECDIVLLGVQESFYSTQADASQDGDDADDGEDPSELTSPLPGPDLTRSFKSRSSDQLVLLAERLRGAEAIRSKTRVVGAVTKK
jgi:hypothetical protein